jgi:hypothetical protein
VATTWVVPEGLTNPLDMPATTGFMSDPDIILTGDKLWLLYRFSDDTSGNREYLYATSSSDGVNWSTPQAILSSIGAARLGYLSSPCIVWDGTQFVLFTVDNTSSPGILNRRTANSISGPWSAPVSCAMYMTRPWGALWHLDVIYQNGGYVALVYPSADNLNFAFSSDGVTWSIYQYSLLAPGASGAWDSSSVYRASLVPNGTGYDIWYSADYNSIWHVGYTTATSTDTGG